MLFLKRFFKIKQTKPFKNATKSQVFQPQSPRFFRNANILDHIILTILLYMYMTGNTDYAEELGNCCKVALSHRKFTFYYALC